MALFDPGYKKHFRVNHGQNEFVQGTSQINGTESFRGYSKTMLSKFRGLSKMTFHLHLKDCEFRFNHRGQDLVSFDTKNSQKISSVLVMTQFF